MWSLIFACVHIMFFVVVVFGLCSHYVYSFLPVFTLCVFLFSRTAPFRQFGDSGIDMEASLDNSEDMMFDQ